MTFRPPPPYEERRARVAVQVFERLHPGVDPDDDSPEFASVRMAANAAFRDGICDLDWEAAILRKLGYTGGTL